MIAIHRFGFRIGIFSFFLAVFALLAESAKGAEEQATFMNQELTFHPKLIQGKLDNGLRYALLPYGEPPNRVSLRLLVRAGSLDEKEGEQGIAHFLEHLAFNGTKHFEAGDMVEYFQHLGMAFGADTNAHTGFRETVYKLELPSNEAQVLEKSFQLLRDYADGMLLKKEEIDRERGVILSEKMSRDTVSMRQFEEQLSFSLPECLLSKRMPIGEEGVIKKVGREDFVNFYRQHYTAGRMVVVATGNLTEKAFKALMAKYFSSLTAAPEKNTLPPIDFGTIGKTGISAKLHTEKEAPSLSISLESVKAIDKKEPDTPHRRLKDWQRDIAAHALELRLENLARKERSPFNKARVYAWDWFDTVELSSVELTCNAEQWKPAIEVLEKEVRRFLDHGMTQAEFTQAFSKVRKKLEEKARLEGSEKTRKLANKIVGAFSDERIYLSPKQRLELFLSLQEKMTPKTCWEGFSQLWNKESFHLFVTGNLELNNAEKQFLDILEKSRSEKVLPLKEEKQAAFAYTSWGESGEISKKTELQELGITQLSFANGIRVNLKSTDFEKGVVRLLLRVGGGLLDLPKPNARLAIWAEHIMENSGLGKHSQEELEQLLAENSVEVTFDIDKDAFALRGKSTEKDLELQLQLLCATLTDPGFRPEATHQFLKELPAIYEELEHSPEGFYSDRIKAFLHGDDARFGYPLMEDVKKGTIEELQHWLTPILASAPVELSIVGDFDIEKIQPLLLKTIAALPNRPQEKKTYASERSISFPKKTSDTPLRFEFESKLPRALALIFWKTEDIRNISRARRLHILADILNDRLRKKIREALGEAYSPYAYHNPSDTFDQYGYLGAYILTDKQHVEKMALLIPEIGDALAIGPIKQDELDRALKPRLQAIKQQMRDNHYWLQNVLATSQEYPERLDWARNIQQDFQSITLPEIQKLAEQYLPKQKALQILVTPNQIGKN